MKEFKLSEKALNKIRKALPPEFESQVESADTDELHTKLNNIQKLQFETKVALDNDEEILQLKEQLKLSSEDYKATIKETSAEIDYIMHVLTNRGAM